MVKDVVGIDNVIGMPVLSRATGNNVGKVYDLYVDPSQGVLLGVTIQAPNGKYGGIDFNNIFSFGKDAIMIESDDQIALINEEWIQQRPHAKKHLVGTNIITEGGNHLGKIGNVYVRLASPPEVIYEVGGSMLDNLFGRNWFIFASSAGALSSNAERLIVPNDAATGAASSLEELLSAARQPTNQAARGGNR